MEIINWSEKYSVGISEIDNQHKGLLVLINELFTLINENKVKRDLSNVFEHLTEYTKKHFFTEETMMLKYEFNDFSEHKEEHNKFIEKLSHLKEEIKNDNVTILLEDCNDIKEWLLNHIFLKDKKYSVLIEKM